MKTDKPERVEKSSTEKPPENPSEDGNYMSEGMLTACERLSNERYQAFVDNISEGVYEVDIHGNFLYFNDSLARVFGYSRDEIQFQNFARFMDEEQAKDALDAFNRMYETGRGFLNLLWKIIDKSGDHRVVELSANLIKNKEGEKVGFRGIARDVTERYRSQEDLRKSERRYRTLLDLAPYAIVVFTPDGRVTYLNPAFTRIFGWTFDELEGKTIPYVPPGLEQETSEIIMRLFEEKVILRHETQRLNKDGRVLDVVLRGAVYSETKKELSGQLVIIRDITREKRIARNNEALLRISMALPEYPDLEDLLDYTSGEVKRLLGTEGSFVILLDEEKNELFFKAVAYDDLATEKRVKEIRFPADKGVSGKVIRTGESVIVPDTLSDPNFYSYVDTKAGFKTRNMLDVPLRSKDRIIGVLCAFNKNTGTFDKTDLELLNMIAGTVALSIDNARVSDELKDAYEEVTSLNRAKDRVINHLSHELKTPISVLRASLNILGKRLSSLKDKTWHATLDRAQRNLDRMLEMQYQVEDIIRERHYHTYHMLSRLLDECADDLASLVAEEVGEGRIVEKISSRIDEIFGPHESPSQEIFLDQFVADTLKEIKPLFAHREVEVVTGLESTPTIRMPVDPLKKVVVGLIKNAVENTPDEGKIEVFVRTRGHGAELLVRDYGVGITVDNQRRIFEGFFPTQETLDYSSKRPFDFNAGGKGADLLRMKIFSERYGFKLEMISTRCGHIPMDKDICPGRISECDFCKEKKDCYESGGTSFTVFFPEASQGSG
ncbi:MAG: PAS domain S-box protein [Deltaproteobacteria bacterium]|nr:PAS domain S-box protein [Deltaproteobacteria bacterium]